MIRRGSALAALSCALLAAISLRYWPRQGEDFVYYYCAGRSAATGHSPYEAEFYQACIDESLGGPNPHASKDSVSVYPPPAIYAFRCLAAPPYRTAFSLWNGFLLLTSGLLFCAVSSDPAIWLLLLTWPGFIEGWVYHKISLPLFLALLTAIRLAAKGRHRLGGALMAVLCIQPQWLAAGGLYLARRRDWLALAIAWSLGVLLFAVCPFEWVGQWFSSAANHSINLIGYDNQSLFISLYKPVSSSIVVNMRMFNVARYGTSLALAALAWRLAKEENSRSLGIFLGFMLLAQPYSHTSDILWAFPLFLTVVEDLERRRGWSHGRAVGAGLLYNAVAIAVSGGFVPGHLHRTEYQYRQGFLACAIAALYLLTKLLKYRHSEPVAQG